MRVHLLSTAVAPLGSGLGGGVETMVINAASQLQTLGHVVQIIAPMGSVAAEVTVITLPGRLAPLRYWDVATTRRLPLNLTPFWPKLCAGWLNRPVPAMSF